MTSILRIAWKNLFRNRRRTLANLTTIALGASALLIYQAFNGGILHEYRENTIHGYYGHGQIFREGYYSQVLEKPWKRWIENPAEVEAKLSKIPEIKGIFPRITVYAFLAKGEKNLGGKGEGIVADRENNFFNQINIEEGHDIQNEKEIILGKGLANSLNVKPGDTVTVLTQTVHGQLNGAELQVAGIFHMGKKVIDDTFFRIPLKVAQELLDVKSVELISIGIEDNTDWSVVEKKIRNMDPQLDPISFQTLDKIYYQNTLDFLEVQFAFIRLVILIVVGLGIFNSISMSLFERAGEVGALRANGESRKRLLAILVSESMLLGLAGGILGIILAVGLDKSALSKGIVMPPGPGVTKPFLVHLYFEPFNFISAVILPMLAAVVAGLWPIQKLLGRSIASLLRAN